MFTIYKATTIYPGADKPTSLYFTTAEAANAFIGNVGEVEECKCNIAIKDGMTWSEIDYYGGTVEDL